MRQAMLSCAPMVRVGYCAPPPGGLGGNFSAAPDLGVSQNGPLKGLAVQTGSVGPRWQAREAISRLDLNTKPKMV